MIRSAGPVLLALSALLVGCAPAPNATTAPTGPPIVEASPTAASPGVSTFSPAPIPSPLESPLASPVGLPAFTTPVPPGAGTAWSGIHWRKLATDDPLAHVRSVVRWRGGFVALGAVIASGQTSSTPLWVSADGVSWRPLDPGVVGPATVVIGVAETATGIVALTLHGGANQCDGQTTPLDCWALTPPLQAWTSSDATNWTSHPGPGIALPSGCDGCGVDVPTLRSGTPGLLVVNHNGGTEWVGARAAFSRDGIAWETLPADAFPSGFAFGDVAGFRSGFIAVGDNPGALGNTGGGETVRAVALSSPDGRHWVTRDLPTAGLDPQAGSTANRIVVGPAGLIATGSDGLAPGTELWWSSVSGSTWSRLKGYPPLGVWTGQGEGSGMMPNGTLLGDGEQMLAYRDGDKPVAWTSSDGRSWRTIAIGGSRPTGSGTLVLLPIGVLWIGDDGSTWFGQPAT
jgi:hypothetical protein